MMDNETSFFSLLVCDAPCLITGRLWIAGHIEGRRKRLLSIHGRDTHNV